jgi:GNAT superfamily N-acetyltransferase
MAESADAPDDEALDPDVAYWLEMAEVIATSDFVVAAIEGMPGNPLGLAVRDVGGGAAVALGAMENPFFNRVIGLGIAREATEADVDDAVRFYKEHDRMLVSIPIAPQARPPELVDWVEARGFPVSRRWPKLWRTLDELPDPSPTELRIEAIGADRAAEFASVVNTAFEFGDALEPMLVPFVGRSGWSHYLGFDGDLAVAAGAMLQIGETAWLGFGATLPTHRGRGGQTAMFQRRLLDAQALGCRLAITETGPDSEEEPNPSYRNMRRLGFQVGYHRPNWVRRPPGA